MEPVVRMLMGDWAVPLLQTAYSGISDPHFDGAPAPE